MKKEFIDNLMVQMKTLQTKLDEEVKRERKEKEELKTNDWRKKFNSNAKLTGDINEAIIISHLMKSGWDVFKNMSCTGPIDMMAYHREKNEVMRLDAKSYETEPTKEQKEKKIYTCCMNRKEDTLMVNKGEDEWIEI